MQKCPLRRLLPTALSVVYFATNCAFAHKPETGMWEERRQSLKDAKSDYQLANLPTEFRSLPLKFSSRFSVPSVLPKQIEKTLSKNTASALMPLLQSLPTGFGTIRRIAVPTGRTSNKIIIHIQDVHMNQEAQKNIGAALQELINQRKVDLLALEGAFAPIDLKSFRSFPHQDTLHKVADYLLTENKISGPIHTALVSPTTIPPIIGIDDKTHYNNNVAAYRRSTTLVKKDKADLAARQNELSDKKKKTLNHELALFDARVEAYRNGALTIGEYLTNLAATKKNTPPAVKMFMEALKLEHSLNFAHVEEERSRLLSGLLTKLNKDETAELINRSLALRMGNLSSGDFYGILQNLCEKNGVNLNLFPWMNHYLAYVSLSESIDIEALFQEMKSMEEDAFASLTKTLREKQLITESKRFHLMGKLLDFALTKEEWSEYKTIRDHSIGQKDFDVVSYEAFYVEAEARDHFMIENLLKAMDEQKAKVAVLVTGGFHASGISEQARAGLTTITFVPKITKADIGNGSVYLSVFTQEKTPLDRLFEGQKLFLASPPIPPQPGAAIGVPTALLEEALDPNRPVSPTIMQRIQGWLGDGSLLNTTDTGPGNSAGVLSTPDGHVVALQMETLDGNIERLTAFGKEETLSLLFNLLGYAISLGVSDPFTATLIRISFNLFSAVYYGFSHETVYYRINGEVVAVREANFGDKLIFSFMGLFFQVGYLASPGNGVLFGFTTHLFHNEVATRLFPFLPLGMVRKSERRKEPSESDDGHFTEGGGELWFNLSSLVGYMKDQVLTKQARPDYAQWINNPQLLKTALQEKTTPFKPYKIDRHLLSQASDPRQALIELISNGMDAVDPWISRFALGFYQALGAMKEPRDRVFFAGETTGSVRTGFVFKAAPNNGVYVRPMTQGELSRILGNRHGETVVHVQKRLTVTEQTAYREFVTERIEGSRRMQIKIGNRLSNPLNNIVALDTELEPLSYQNEATISVKVNKDGYTVRNPGFIAPTTLFENLITPRKGRTSGLDRATREQSKEPEVLLKASPHDAPTETCRVSFQVAGMGIEVATIHGVGLPAQLIINLPPEVTINVSRAKVIIDDAYVKAMKKVIDQVIRAPDIERAAAVANALMTYWDQFEANSRQITYDLKMPLAAQLRTTLKERLASQPDIVVLPAFPLFQKLRLAGEGSRTIYLYAGDAQRLTRAQRSPIFDQEGERYRLFDFESRPIPGLEPVNNFKSEGGFKLYHAAFQAGVAHPPIVRIGRLIVLNRDIYLWAKDKTWRRALVNWWLTFQIGYGTPVPELGWWAGTSTGEEKSETLHPLTNPQVQESDAFNRAQAVKRETMVSIGNILDGLPREAWITWAGRHLIRLPGGITEENARIVADAWHSWRGWAASLAPRGMAEILLSELPLTALENIGAQSFIDNYADGMTELHRWNPHLKDFEVLRRGKDGEWILVTADDRFSPSDLSYEPLRYEPERGYSTILADGRTALIDDDIRYQEVPGGRILTTERPEDFNEGPIFALPDGRLLFPNASGGRQTIVTLPHSDHPPYTFKTADYGHVLDESYLFLPYRELPERGSWDTLWQVLIVNFNWPLLPPKLEPDQQERVRQYLTGHDYEFSSDQGRQALHRLVQNLIVAPVAASSRVFLAPHLKTDQLVALEEETVEMMRKLDERQLQGNHKLLFYEFFLQLPPAVNADPPLLNRYAQRWCQLAEADIYLAFHLSQVISEQGAWRFINRTSADMATIPGTIRPLLRFLSDPDGMTAPAKRPAWEPNLFAPTSPAVASLDPLDLSELLTVERASREKLKGEQGRPLRLSKIKQIVHESLNPHTPADRIDASSEAEAHQRAVRAQADGFAVWIRELVQNARDELRRFGRLAEKIRISCWFEGRKRKTRISDPIGMNLDKLLHVYLPVDVSDKPIGLTGKIGQGKESVWLDADVVRLRTGDGSGTSYSLRLIARRDTQRRLLGVHVEHFEEFEDGFQGTVIEHERNYSEDDNSGLLETALLQTAIYRFLGDVRDVEILFQNQPVTEETATLASVHDTELQGSFDVGWTRDGIARVTADGFEVHALEDKDWEGIPLVGRVQLERGGNVLFRWPAGTPLTQPRTEAAMNEIRDPVRWKRLRQVSVLRANVDALLNHGLWLPDLPEDILYRFPTIDERVRQDAEAINAGNWWDVDFDYYLDRPETYLLLCSSVRDQKTGMSVLDLNRSIETAAQRDDQSAIEQLAQRVPKLEERIRHAYSRDKQRFTEDQRVGALKPTTEKSLDEAGFAALARLFTAFAKATTKTGDRPVTSVITPREDVAAFVSDAEKVFFSEKWASLMELFLRANAPVEPTEQNTRDFLERATTISHERAHNKEFEEFGQSSHLTHGSSGILARSFPNSMSEILLRALTNKLDLEEVFQDIRSEDETPSITALALNQSGSRLLRSLRFGLPTPLQEGVHAFVVLTLGRFFGMTIDWKNSSLWTSMRIGYNHAPPLVAAVVRLSGPFTNLLVGVIGLALQGLLTSDVNHFLSFTTLLYYFFASNVLLAVTDLVLLPLASRKLRQKSDIWKAIQDVRRFFNPAHSAKELAKIYAKAIRSFAAGNVSSDQIKAIWGPLMVDRLQDLNAEGIGLSNFTPVQMDEFLRELGNELKQVEYAPSITWAGLLDFVWSLSIYGIQNPDRDALVFVGEASQDEVQRIHRLRTTLPKDRWIFVIAKDPRFYGEEFKGRDSGIIVVDQGTQVINGNNEIQLRALRKILKTNQTIASRFGAEKDQKDFIALTTGGAALPRLADPNDEQAVAILRSDLQGLGVEWSPLDTWIDGLPTVGPIGFLNILRAASAAWRSA